MKRFFALLLVCALFLGVIPSALGAKSETDTEPKVLTEEDYALADLMWEVIIAKETELLNKRAPATQMTETLIAAVTSSSYYAEGSLIRNGEHFFWETVDGIACGYSPRLRQQARNARALEGYDAETAETVLTSSYATRGGGPGKNDVYLIQPYYGLDSDFTTQYVMEASSIAKALGGTATTYRTTNATIDNIADSLEAGAVVIFDSHGDTDYADDAMVDFATRANTSYICLQTNEGITDKDMEAAKGKFGAYYHAYYAGSYGKMKYYCVNGTAIANHMEGKSQNGLLWMALCLSMTTDGLHAPLRDKGVEVAYGYSQSVTFDYDYDWEEVFWSEMRGGSTVATAISAMKSEVGLWDWCHSSDYDTIPEARAEYCAFPIVVSSEDQYPGHGKVDDLQTVKSSWTLFGGCKHELATHVPAVPATCTTDGNIAYYVCTQCGGLFADQAMTTPITQAETVVKATGHAYDEGVITTAPTCMESGVLTYTCGNCGDTYTEALLALGHSYEERILTPTCTEEGGKANVCALCGDVQILEAVPPTGHAYGEGVVTPPTCTAEGYTTSTCVVCGESQRTDIVSPTGHSFEEGICTACGEEELPDNPFEDVKEENYFYTPVLWAVGKEITNGTTPTTFSPDKACTRGQVVTFLWRAAGSPEPEGTENPFADVAADAYYYKAVLWAVEQGITNGLNATTFGPDKTCTRGQVATFLWRAQDKPAAENSENPFSDVKDTDYYYEAVLWAVENEITQGTGKGKFSPDNSCTRGQIVTFLYRALKK
ncbi:MAG: S-layer homology domain-containing protein [Oscillospiraceae bacterium]|nr:S-layer homology domain-containing protein [Oscillospiraceae bacterium]